MRALAVLVATLVAGSSVLGAAAARSPAPEQHPPASSERGSDGHGRDPAPAGCRADTIACELPVPAPGCEPRVGIHCIEAFADAALMSWILEQRPMPSQQAILEVVDDRVLVIGFAHGYGEPDLDVEVVEREHHVSITLRFDFHPAPSLGGDVTAGWSRATPPIIQHGRVVVELDEALGDRAVDVWTSYTPT